MDAKQRQTGNNSIKIVNYFLKKVFISKQTYFIEIQQV